MVITPALEAELRVKVIGGKINKCVNGVECSEMAHSLIPKS